MDMAGNLVSHYDSSVFAKDSAVPGPLSGRNNRATTSPSPPQKNNGDSDELDETIEIRLQRLLQKYPKNERALWLYREWNQMKRRRDQQQSETQRQRATVRDATAVTTTDNSKMNGSKDTDQVSTAALSDNNPGAEHVTTNRVDEINKSRNNAEIIHKTLAKPCDASTNSVSNSGNETKGIITIVSSEKNNNSFKAPKRQVLNETMSTCSSRELPLGEPCIGDEATTRSLTTQTKKTNAAVFIPMMIRVALVLIGIFGVGVLLGYISFFYSKK